MSKLPVQPFFVVPTDYPWTGHADEIVAACAAGGLTYQLESNGHRRWNWTIDRADRFGRMTVEIGRDGYFTLAHGHRWNKTKERFVYEAYSASGNKNAPRTRRQAFDDVLAELQAGLPVVDLAPDGYWWTHHADELEAACVEGECAYVIATDGEGWVWTITHPDLSIPISVYLGARGYFERATAFGREYGEYDPPSWSDANRQQFERVLERIRTRS